MDLFSQFDQRRGVNPPIPASNTEVAPPVPDAATVLAVAFAGQLRKSYLLTVEPPFQNVFGQNIWLCPTEDQAKDKQRQSTILAFYPGELMDICSLALGGVQRVAGLIEAKRIFGGTVQK